MADSNLSAPLAALRGAVPPAPGWFRDALACAPERSLVGVAGAGVETLAWGERGAPGLLLTHGNGAHADWYSFIAPLLARGRRVVAMSWSGMGGSEWRPAYSLDLYVEEAFAVARSAGLFDADVAPVFAGHSFGAFPLMACAGRAGEQLGAVVLMDAPLLSREQRAARRARRGPSRPHTRPARFYPTLEDALSRFRFMPEQRCEHLFIADHVARGSLRQVPAPDGSGSGWTWRFDPSLWSRYTSTDLADELPFARCPVAILYGARSGLVDASVVEYMRGLLPGETPVVRVPDADHHVMIDQPLATVAALDGLLAGWPG